MPRPVNRGERLAEARRNPSTQRAERTAVRYASAARLPLRFEEFIRREEHRNLQVRRIAGIVDLDKAKEEIERHYFFVGLTERFGESIRLFQKLCPYEIDPRYKSLKVARDNTIKRQVPDDPATRELLREANAVDQELYDYVRRFVYPAQLKKAGLVAADAEDGQ